MDKRKLRKKLLIINFIYILISLGVYFLSYEQFRYQKNETNLISSNSNVGEITQEVVLEQHVNLEGDELEQINILAGTFNRTNTGFLNIDFFSNDGSLLTEKQVDISSVVDNDYISINFSPALVVPNSRLNIRITAPDSKIGNAITLYTGNSILVSKHDINMPIQNDEFLRVNGIVQNNILCEQFFTAKRTNNDIIYLVVVIIGFIILFILSFRVYLCNKKGHSCCFLKIISVFNRYGFLMKQLINRDFKTKYKRSVLGVFWSFLNPLMTMCVQYIIFSTIFKSDIPNFAVYLLTGIVCYSFFNEASTMALGSIVGNSTLIQKVYVPKYIYPFTRVVSSLVNFLFALIPLLLVIIVTRTPIRPVILLLPLGISFLFFLVLGIGFILATLMVFFRDTQFLWSVISMIWMYATPIFYPESIISAKLLPFFKCNPLYQVIKFMRIILIDGVAPNPICFLGCIITTLIPFILGTMIFKKYQDNFVLNL